MCNIYNQFIDEVKEVIKREHYEPLAYRNGIALADLMHNCTCSDEMRDWLYAYIDEEYAEVIAKLKEYGLSDGDLDTWQGLIEVDDLDAIVTSWSLRAD